MISYAGESGDAAVERDDRRTVRADKEPGPANEIIIRAGGAVRCGDVREVWIECRLEINIVVTVLVVRERDVRMHDVPGAHAGIVRAQRHADIAGVVANVAAEIVVVTTVLGAADVPAGGIVVTGIIVIIIADVLAEIVVVAAARGVRIADIDGG